ncbi:MAG: sulfur carrier protein ThiS, partial [Thermoguttaceae bacterium]
VMRILVNGQSQETADAMTVAELLLQLKLNDKPVAVEVNQVLLPRQKHAQHRLSDGDKLEIVTLVGGG